MNDTVPPGRRLERAALERVILRAAQLQGGSRSLEDGLTEDDVLQLGAEVGIPAPYLRQALMEEQMRASMPEERSLMAWLSGPRFAAAERTVSGTTDEIGKALEYWMAEGELLIVKRRFADQTTWEPRRGTMASLKRSFRMGGRDYVLARVREVAAQVSAIAEHRAYVRLVADVGNVRRERLGGATALVALGAATTGVMALLGFALPIAALAVPVAGAGALAVSRRYPRELEKAQVALEQILDRLEHGEIKVPPPKDRQRGLPGLERLADEIRRSFRP